MLFKTIQNRDLLGSLFGSVKDEQKTSPEPPGKFIIIW